MEAKITITGTEKVLNVWTMATAEVGSRKYYIEMVRFDEPSIYGIRKGRISKLWVRGADGTAVINYDRGWDIRPATDGGNIDGPSAGTAILAAITKRFN